MGLLGFLFLGLLQVQVSAGLVLRRQTETEKEAHIDDNDGSVPFYIHDFSSLIDGHPAEEWLWEKGLADWALHEGLKNHPWRTFDPENAKLFFVPGYLSAALYDWNGKNIWPSETKEQTQERFDKLSDALTSSPHYMKNWGKDHFISGHCFVVKPRNVGKFAPVLSNMSMIVEDLKTRRESVTSLIPAPYGDALDSIRTESISAPAFSERKHTLIFIGQAHIKGFRPWGYNERRAAIENLGAAFPDSVLVCIKKCNGFKKRLPKCQPDGDKLLNGCKTGEFSKQRYAQKMLDAKFGLMLPGDTPSSSRLYDIISSGSIPIIVDRNGAHGQSFKDHAMPFKEDLDWSKFAFMLDAEKFMADPEGTITKIVASPQALIDEKLRGLKEVQTSLDWVTSSGESMVPSLVLRAVARAKGQKVAPMDFRKMPASKIVMPESAAMLNLFKGKHFDVDDEFWSEGPQFE